MRTEPERGSLAPVPYVAALDQVRSTLSPIGIERIPIERAVDRIAARDLVAPSQIPSHPLSTRGGFALRAADTQAGSLRRPQQMQVIGTSFPDTPPSSLPSLTPGSVVAVSGGAPLPPGADAVVPTEMVDVREDRVLIAVPVRAGSCVLFPGDEVRDGTPLVSEGRYLGPSQLGLLAATGLSHIEVYKTPRVALISPATEAFEETESFEPGDETLRSDRHGRHMPASNAVTLGAWCSRFGLSVKRWNVCRDGKSLISSLGEASDECDAIITSGNAGPGTLDSLHETLGQLDGELLFDGILLRPGRATSLGLIQGKPIFLLPGTPTANETAFLLLALPGLLALSGTIEPPFPVAPVRFGKDVRRSPEQMRWTQAVRVRFEQGAFFLQAMPLPGRAVREKQGRLAALASADGILILGEDQEGPRMGDIMSVILLESSWA
ncbi:MAG: molybdopterin molybdotransferase MoeA [Candidatus Eisenbacteria sp.]|nr:molybdopterin molybdotransferase MoeA [Candidatus Eisenbacteria bacterium]